MNGRRLSPTGWFDDVAAGPNKRPRDFWGPYPEWARRPPRVIVDRGVLTDATSSDTVAEIERNQ